MTYFTAAITLALALTTGAALASGQGGAVLPVETLTADQLDALAALLGASVR